MVCSVQSGPEVNQMQQQTMRMIDKIQNIIEKMNKRVNLLEDFSASETQVSDHEQPKSMQIMTWTRRERMETYRHISLYTSYVWITKKEFGMKKVKKNRKTTKMYFRVQQLSFQGLRLRPWASREDEIEPSSINRQKRARANDSRNTVQMPRQAASFSPVQSILIPTTSSKGLKNDIISSPQYKQIIPKAIAATLIPKNPSLVCC